MKKPINIHSTEQERLEYIKKVKQEIPEIENEYLKKSDKFFSVGSEMKREVKTFVFQGKNEPLKFQWDVIESVDLDPTAHDLVDEFEEENIPKKRYEGPPDSADNKN